MSLSLRAGALLAAGTLSVHELRYLVGYADDPAAAARGHAYLGWVAPAVALALAVACGAWLGRIGRRPGRTLTWLGASGSIAAAYVAQETIEALVTPGHAGLLAHGGWIAAPIAFAVGGLLTLMLRGARAADEAARPWTPPTCMAVAAAPLALPALATVAPRRRPLARRLAGRAPPLAS